MQLVILLIALILSCSNQPNENTESLRIATSIYPIQDLTQQMAGEYADVFHLIPAGANPHHFEPPPSIIRQLQNVDLFVGVHPDFDGWIEDLLPVQTPRFYLHPNAKNDETEHPENLDHDHSFNPHFWLSIRTTQNVLGQIALTLCKTDTLHCEAYKQNLQDYQSRLDSLDQEIQNQLLPFQNKAFIQWHPAWDGFASDFGLRIAGTMEYGHGNALPMRSFQKIIQNAKSEGVRLVVIGLNVESDAIIALVRELNGQLLRLNTIGGPEQPEADTYIKMMATNARYLAQAFGEL
ncbi:zinc ABC transporter substrate-binding protein [candidate division KSB1 bacterium]|nr:zinc ABC transporter substrate-binding protein [candidate division KSB1 bacterium]